MNAKTSETNLNKNETPEKGTFGSWSILWTKCRPLKKYYPAALMFIYDVRNVVMVCFSQVPLIAMSGSNTAVTFTG